jgi:hypothetical protein
MKLSEFLVKDFFIAQDIQLKDAWRWIGACFIIAVTQSDGLNEQQGLKDNTVVRLQVIPSVHS